MKPGVDCGTVVFMDGKELVKVEAGAGTEAFKWLTSNGFFTVSRRTSYVLGVRIVLATFTVPRNVREEMLQTVR